MSDELPLAHDNKMVLASEAFRALNVFIDNQVTHLTWLHDVLKRSIEQMLVPGKYTPSISTRSAQEDKNGGDVPLLFESREFDQITVLMEEIKETEALIHKIVRYKIRLLNDYDFTKGNNSEQIAVFGPVSDEKEKNVG